MRLQTLVAAAVAPFVLGACVVLDTAPPQAVGPGPFLTGGTTSPQAGGVQLPDEAPQFSLRDQLSGRVISGQGAQLVLQTNGSVTGTFVGPGGQLQPANGQWSAGPQTLCLNAAGSIQPENCGLAEVQGQTLFHDWSNGRSPVVTYAISSSI